MRVFKIAILSAILTLVISSAATAAPHLEVGALGTTTTVLDDSFEFFSEDYMVLDSWGFDVRVEVLEIKDVLHLLPFISYRYGNSSGYPQLVNEAAQTDLTAHDIELGARMRGWFLPWLGAFAQLYTGVSHLQMEVSIPSNSESSRRNIYRDDKNKWNLGATMGVELRISPRVLKRHNIRRFNLGGELGVGFIKRMTTNFNPTLEGGDEYSITDADTVNFGDIDLSGVVVQFGLTLSFL